MRKRMTSLLLTLVMLLSLVPAMGVTANAEDGFVEVSTYEQLRNEVKNGSAKIKLMADIDTTNENGGVGVTTATNLSFKGSGNVLDLNGHKLKLVSNMSVYFIEIYSSDLTIKDSGTNGRIDFEYGEAVLGVQRAIVISRSVGVKKAGSLTVDGGTLSSTYLAIILIESYGSITINGGRLYAPVTNSGNSCYIIHSTNRYDLDDTLQLHVNGGELDGRVVLKRDDSSATGTLKYTVTPIKITNGTFKQGLYATWKTWDSPEGKPKNAVMTMDSPTVEITGGVFEKNNEEYSSYASSIRIDLPTKLRGGTFKNGATIRFVGGKYTWDATQPQYRASIGNSAILRGNDIRTAYDWSKSDWFEIQSPWIYLTPKGTSVTVIPDAWGVMESVTLDGTKKINYAKDWNGAAVEITNDTAHTLTFTWKPLAQELKDAGYSYRANFDCYTVGSNTPTSVPISATATEYSHTIPAGEAPSVYPFDLQLNLKKNDSDYNVGIMSNQHIVKLVVSEAPVAPPSLTGQVYYTSGIVFGSPISIAASVTPAEATKSYQWQRSTDSGSTWENIDGETSGKYTPVAADMGENIRIRVKVTAEGYLGEIVGAPLTVSKAANNKYPEVIQLEAVQDEAGNYIGFKINNYDSDCEYVYTTSAPTSGNEWPTGGTEIDSNTVTSLTGDKTYYVFARFEETKTHTAGSIVSRNSIGLFDKVPLQYVLLEGYVSGEKIYIKEGESVTLKVSADPSNANSWQEITFKDDSNTTPSHIAISNGTITASGTTATPFPNDYTITIKGDSKGSATLSASYPSYPPSAYGTWPVVVYDDSTVANALRLENVYTYADITLSVNDEAKLPTDLPKLLPEDSGYHLEWRIFERSTTGTGFMHVTENENIKLEDGKIIKPIKATESEKIQLELVAVKEGSTEYKTLPKTSLFYVTVTEAPTITLTDLIVVPKQVNLEKAGDTRQLSAVKEPVNAAGTLEWTSSNTDVVTVDTTGKVTAVAKGEATITVTCGDKKATCTVTVDHTHNTDAQPWVYMDPGTHIKTCTAGDDFKTEQHKFSEWKENNDGETHTGTCTECGYEKTENHSWVVDHEDAPTANAEGTRYYKCSATGCTATKTESIPMLTEYSVTVKDDGNGTASASPATAVAGTEITLSAKAKSGYHFKEWQVVSGGVTLANETSATTTFIMPAEDVEIEANFEKNASTGTGTGTGATTYPITVKSAKNGDVTASHKSASKGTTVTLTVDPDKGYVLDTLTVLDGKDKELKLTEKNGKYTFTMPDSKVTVAATFKASAPTGKHPFTDVPAGAYYEDAVVWAVGRNITTGMSATTFDPNGSCTRAQIVTFLWRAAGSPEPKTMKGFDDVASNAYYAKAVAWAVENGITTGTSASKFSPNDPCTRTQAVTFLFRYAAANGMEAVTMQELLSGYADAASVPSYAVSAMNWALAAGILQGDGVKLMPNATCTRAQIVTFLYRAMK